ncbi:MAG: hypothetical protein WBE80_04185 [Methylocella sp.]
MRPSRAGSASKTVTASRKSTPTIKRRSICGTKYAKRYLGGSGFTTGVSGISNHRQTPTTFGCRSTGYVERTDLSERFLNYILRIEDMDDFLSAVEIGCVGLSDVHDEGYDAARRGAVQKGVDAIEEINRRFEQHSVGYQFENGQIIRVDSKLTHAEVIKPALILLTAPEFTKANEDFMTAHRHYRANEFKDCVTAANRAFESMLKAICDTENWEYGKGDRASEMVTKVRNKGLFTHYFDRSFESYVAMLKAGLPAVRNDAGGHGEGLASAAVTAGIARFAINLTATNLVFLGDSYSAMKSGQRRR